MREVEILTENPIRYFLVPLTGVDMSICKFRSTIEAKLHVTQDIIRIQSGNLIPGTVVPFLIYRPSHQSIYSYYKILEEFIPDVEKFRYGFYSQMSARAKFAIRKKSGLRYMDTDSVNLAKSDSRLLALEKHQTLRGLVEDYYNCTLDEDDELMIKPKDDWFFENITS